MKYKGYMIQRHVSPEDAPHVAERYAEMCRRALAAEFPGAEIDVYCGRPTTMQTRVIDPDLYSYESSYDNGEGGRLVTRVNDICARVWQAHFARPWQPDANAE